MKKIISVVGARPNFMKVAPVHNALKQYPDIRHLICHTGQHYDEKMSKVFFEDLELPQPEFYLGVGSGTHAEQTARVMVEFEKVIDREHPDLVIVVGDVNSTIACSLVAAKALVPIAHVEAGLRSFDRTMPEEINRLLTDALSEYLFVTETSGLRNLEQEGVANDRVFFVGNVMIDSVARYLPKASGSDILKRFSLEPSGFAVATFHRPSNVDTAEGLDKIVRLLNSIAERKTVVFPVHPRTRANLSKLDTKLPIHANVRLTDPVGYLDFLWLMKNAALVMTDSGGIQEETTYLGIPCITLRENTERPVTVEEGTNYLEGNFEKAETIGRDILAGKGKKGKIPELWDGKAAERIAEVITKRLRKA